MTTEKQAAAHRVTLERLSVDGGPLSAEAKTLASKNPEWFNLRRAEPRSERRLLHNDIVTRFIESMPEVRRGKKAIVLAGPPGVGKSTAQDALIQTTGTQKKHWLSINADDFKDKLLQQALRDGSYGSYLMPAEVQSLEASGEKFYPRELAALVHAESSLLARKTRGVSLKSGLNVVIDGTLGNNKHARALLELLQAAEYDVLVASVETTQAITEARSMGRWELGYLAAENGTAKGLDAELGGRWVPLSFVASLFNEANALESICASNAAAMAADFGCVSEYRVYRVAEKVGAPKLTKRQTRAKPHGSLVVSEE
ncbi:AAA family ATPase [Paenarthrobacter sp. CM16]|uniref:zeta toxin family protein n=1 Tax=Paenarthrobacter sp. CM16 TaxID=2738447 RepID=UPI0015543CB9|nr:zeta toxin family protein [Paenarthrobacter sp. CM16]NQD89477.1 AAA family ATPase [Paenarthrobacter sp. CM16]